MQIKYLREKQRGIYRLHPSLYVASALLNGVCREMRKHVNITFDVGNVTARHKISARLLYVAGVIVARDAQEKAGAINE